MENKINPVYELPSDEYNVKLAEVLKSISEFEAPEWSFFVKTGVSKDRPPQEIDFWFKRAASILRQIYINNVVGVNRLRTRYGSKQNRGVKPEKFKKSSGKIIRVILQQAEAAGILEKHNIPGKRAGRKVTDKGKELLEGVGINEKPKSVEQPKPVDVVPKDIPPTEEKEEMEEKEEEKEEVVKEKPTVQPTVDDKINNEESKE